jgi:hypothetical protein
MKTETLVNHAAELSKNATAKEQHMVAAAAHMNAGQRARCENRSILAQSEDTKAQREVQLANEK